MKSRSCDGLAAKGLLSLRLLPSLQFLNFFVLFVQGRDVTDLRSRMRCFLDEVVVVIWPVMAGFYELY